MEEDSSSSDDVAHAKKYVSTSLYPLSKVFSRAEKLKALGVSKPVMNVPTALKR